MITGFRGDTFIPKGVYRSTRIKPILRIILDENNNFVRRKDC